MRPNRTAKALIRTATSLPSARAWQISDGNVLPAKDLCRVFSTVCTANRSLSCGHSLPCGQFLCHPELFAMHRGPFAVRLRFAVRPPLSRALFFDVRLTLFPCDLALPCAPPLPCGVRCRAPAHVYARQRACVGTTQHAAVLSLPCVWARSVRIRTAKALGFFIYYLFFINSCSLNAIYIYTDTFNTNIIHNLSNNKHNLSTPNKDPT